MLHSVNLSLLLTSLISYITAYRLRQNAGLAGYEDPYSLSNALDAIEVQRRQLAEPLGARYSDDFGDEYLYPGEIRQTSRNDDTMNNYFEGLGNIPYSLEGYPYRYQSRLRKLNSPQKRTAYKPRRVAPTVDELRELFGSANLPVKRVVPVKRRYFEAGPNDQMIAAAARDDANNKKKRLADRMRQLLDAAEEKGSETVLTETKTSKDADEPEEEIEEVDISETKPLDDNTEKLTEKLVEVFEDAMSKDDNQNKNDVKDTIESDTISDTDLVAVDNEEAPPGEKNDELEELITEYLSKSQSKSKRASSVEKVNVEVLLDEIAQLKDELSSAQVRSALEDRENDYLARALKYATLDQLSDGDDFMAKEYEDIAKATETEELLQILSRVGLSGEDTEVGGLEMDEEPGILEKRDEFDSDGWYDTPVTEKVVGGAELQGSDQGSEFPIDIPYPDDVDEEEEEEVEEEDPDELGDDLIGEEPVEVADIQGKDNQLLQRLLTGLTPGELQELSDALSEDNQNDLDSEICPAVMELSTNCAFTDRHGILLDDEAKNLCNRHEMCYKCGPTIGLTQNDCDDGYENTVMEACEGDVRCLRSSILFLKLMQGYHSYPLISTPQCQQPCVERFVYEGD